MTQGPADDRPPEVAAHFAAAPEAMRPGLERLRLQIRAVAPDAVESISYGVPAFRYHGRPLVAYAATKGHLSFFPMSPAVLDAQRSRLAGFDLAKGTVRFGPDQPIPDEVVGAIVRARMAEIDRG